MQNKSNKLAIISNRIIDARYKLTTSEQHLLLLMITRIEFTTLEFEEYQITVSELSEALQIESPRIYSHLKNIANKLMTRTISIESSPNNWQLMHWVENVSCVDGVFHFIFNKKLKPYLLQLRNCFTKVDFYTIIQFKSIYTIRIYQILFSHLGIGYRKFQLDDLKEMLSLNSEDQYKDFRNFNKRVILTARQELDSNPLCKITFSIEQFKHGKTIVALKFIIIKKQEHLDNKTECSIKQHLKKALEQKRPVDAIILKPDHIASKPHWGAFIEYLKTNDPQLLSIFQSDGAECFLIRAEYHKFLSRLQ